MEYSVTVSAETKRAFLSYASVDSRFVDAVAVKLGRQQVIYDKWCFETGTQFIAAIRQSLNQSDCFVLFVSRIALRSLWVKFEIAGGRSIIRLEKLKSILVLIVDPGAHHADLPN